MKTIIIYSTLHGSTTKAVTELAQNLSGEVAIINLNKNPSPQISGFDRVIIGGSIHAGQIQKNVRNFCKSNINSLNNSDLGLFVCCMYEPKIAREEIRNAFPEELHQMAKTEAIFGGEFDFDKMNFVEKMMVRKIAKVNESVSKIDHDSIERFANRMEKTYHPFLFLV